MIAFQNLCTLPDNLNQNSRGSVNTVQVRIEEIIEIFSDNKNYKKLNMCYHSQIAAVLAFSISILKPLFEARYIFKHKTQTQKGLATPKMARYKTWRLVRGYLENNIKIADILKTIQKSR